MEATMATKTRVTAEDLWQMPEEERGDLINGEVVREPYTGWPHGRVMFRLGSLANFFQPLWGGRAPATAGPVSDPKRAGAQVRLTRCV